jgi:DNA-binding transcriptional LysR family regulator
MDRPDTSRLRVNFQLLALFDRVAKERTIAGAARHLGLSASMATRKIASLERAMNVRLFQRTTRSMRLTESGMIALDWAREVLASYETVSDDMAVVQDQPSGIVRLASNEHTATVWLPEFLDSFSRRYPEIRYAISNTDALVDLREFEYDLAIHTGRIPDSSVIGIRLRDVERILCASPSYLDRLGRPTRPEHLADHDCLIHLPTEPGNWFFRHGKRLIGQTVKQAIISDSYLPLMEFARKGLGILRMGRQAVQDDLESGRLVRVLPDYKCVYPTGEVPGIWLLYPNRRLTRRTRVFADALAEYIRKRPRK